MQPLAQRQYRRPPRRLAPRAPGLGRQRTAAGPEGSSPDCARSTPPADGRWATATVDYDEVAGPRFDFDDEPREQGSAKARASELVPLLGRCTRCGGLCVRYGRDGSALCLACQTLAVAS